MTDDLPHRITTVERDDNGADAYWACECGEVNTGYADLHEAALNAAEHQLPRSVQDDIMDHVPRGPSVDEWRSEVRQAADNAAAADPLAWQWYLDAMKGKR